MLSDNLLKLILDFLPFISELVISINHSESIHLYMLNLSVFG
jgi:hypothetical protein